MSYSRCWFISSFLKGIMDRVVASLSNLPHGMEQHFSIEHDDVIKWKHFPRNWPFVREIHRSPVNFPHKGQWRGALMFSLIYAWINDWVNNREAGDLRRQHGHYDVIVMVNMVCSQDHIWIITMFLVDNANFSERQAMATLQFMWNICIYIYIQNKFITTWNTHLQNTMLYPRLRTYRRIKYDYVMEPCLYLVKKSRYSLAIARFRCSSHTLEIEKGRHTNPKTPVAERKCRRCDVIEDEKHLLLMCDMNMEEREYFFQKISRVYVGFTRLNNEEKFSLILNNDDPQCLSRLGEFLHRFFEKRTADSSNC